MFANGVTTYMLVGIRFERRDLAAELPDYRRYQRNVPMLLPSWRKRLLEEPDAGRTTLSNYKQVAFLTMQDPGDFVTDFDIGIAPLAALGWSVETVPWRSQPDWNRFDAVYICTPWDYPQHADEFIAVLQQIEASAALLFNDLATVLWNLDKSYLRDMQARGDDIVPSLWFDGFHDDLIADFFAAHDTDRVVIKPVIGANAQDTFVLSYPVDAECRARLSNVFAARRFIVQPFIENIQSEGEFSLFFFDGAYSHAIQKTPQPGDFRVQEEHGAEITPVTPPDALRAVAERVFSHLDPVPVYGRGDWVRAADGRFLLMELELIEPSLYLRTDRGAAARFARAFDQRFEKLSGK